MEKIRSLKSLVSGWSDDAPQFGDQLLEADPLELDDLARELRRHIVSAVKSSHDVTFRTPLEVKFRLERHHLAPSAGKWVSLVLDRNRSRVMVPTVGGGMQALRKVSRRVPTVDFLCSEAPVPSGGAYLLVYGGSPEVLDLVDRNGFSVAHDVQQLVDNLPVADVVFWFLQKNQSPTFYSVRAGVGDQGGAVLQFPDLKESVVWRT